MPSREAFRIGDLVIHWYGIMIMLGVIAASYIAYREAQRRREDPDHVWGLFPWVLIAGIVGARIGWVIASLGEESMRNPANWFKIWEGGLSIHGAIIGGAVAVALYCKRYNISFFKWSDIIVPGVALAQAIGRWGNYFNQEAFGRPTDLPWGIPISTQRQQEVAGEVFGEGTRFHPTFAYEMIWDLMNFALLMWLGRQRRFRLKEGDILWVYLIFYSIGRYIIEELRVDSATVGGLKTPQLISIALIVLAWIMLIVRHRPDSTAPDSPENLPPAEYASFVRGDRRSRASRPVKQSSKVRYVRKAPALEDETEGEAAMTNTDGK